MDVIIIGGLHHNTLGVIRSLGERIEKSRMQVLIVSDKIEKKNIISTSKYVAKERLYYVDTYGKIVPWLKKLMEDRIERIIISCADGVTSEIIGHKNELKEFYLMPDTKFDILSLMSKETQSKLAAKAGLRVPESIVLKKGEKIEWDVFPCIAKPLSSTSGGGKADIHVIQSKAEFENIVSSIDAKSIQIQRFIKKKTEFQLIGCSINAGEKIFIPGYTDIIRQPENTNTGYLKYSPICQFTYDQSAVEKFICSIGYSGLFSVEFIRDDNNDDYFLEINLRNDGNAYCVKTAGVNLPYIWYYYLANNKLPDGEPLSFEKSVMFVPDLLDFMRGVREVGLFGWIKQFSTAESHAVWDSKDRGPFWIQITMFAKIAFKRVIRIK